MSITKLNNLSISAITALPSGVGGKVLQVITATDSTQRNTTSASFVTASNTLSVTITPSSASNKIFILVTCCLYVANAGGYGEATIFRGATNLGGTHGMAVVYGGASTVLAGVSFSNLDSPNTTSATTYQVYIRQEGPTQTYLNEPAPSKSSITAFEIAG